MSKKKDVDTCEYWLIKNDGVELETVAGPIVGWDAVEEKLRQICKEDRPGEEVVFHAMHFHAGPSLKPGALVPTFEEFSGGFMDELRGEF